MAQHTPKFYDLYDTCMMVSRNLKSLAMSFSDVGNDVVSDRLTDAASTLEVAAKEAHREVGSNLEADLKQSQEFTGLLFKAALEGCLQPPKKSKKSEAANV